MSKILCSHQASNIIIVFLPPNVTSMVQPLQQGIIAPSIQHKKDISINLILVQLIGT